MAILNGKDNAHDVLHASDDGDTIDGGKGNDKLYGGAGDDTFVGQTGDGHDTFVGGEGWDHIDWTGTVSLMGNFSYAANGIEEITAEHITSYTASSNTLDFRGIKLNLTGEIQGGAGHNTIYASGGDDIIRGGGGNDTLHGEGGNDTFVGQTGDGHDTFFGGAGYDQIVWTGTVSLMGSFSYAVNSIEKITATNITSFTSSSNTLDFRGVELELAQDGEIQGGAGHNTIYASEGADIIRGGKGNDTLHGEGGDDKFVGETGDGFDKFFGGAGNNTIDWGNGALGLMNNFGADNAIASITAWSITGYASTSLDFSRTAFVGVTQVNADNSVSGTAHTTVVTSLSRGTEVTYDGGKGNDKVTVTLAASDFAGANASSRAGLIKDIYESQTGSYGNATGFAFDDSLGVTVQNFNSGLSYGWFTLAGTLATASLANVKFANGAIQGTGGNDILVGTTNNNLDTFLGGAGDDLIIHATGNYDRIVTGAGDDTIIVVGNRGGRINDTNDTGGIPDTGLDQMFVVDGTTFTLDGALRGIEHIEFVSAEGAGRIVSNGTAIQTDFTNTVLSGVNLVKGSGGNDTFITAKEHHDVGDGRITYDGGNLVPYDAITVNFGAFTQVATGNGLRNDLEQLLNAKKVAVDGFTFDTAFDGFDLRIQNIGDNRVDLDAGKVKLGYIGHDGELVTVAPTADNIKIGNVPSTDTLTGTSGNDILLRGANGEIMNGGAGDDLIVGFSGYSGGLVRADGGEGNDTYLLGSQSTRVEDTGNEGHDRILAVQDGNIGITYLLEGIEEINANGFDVELHGSSTNDVLWLEDTLLVGIDTVRTFSNSDTIHTSTKDHHVTYDGGDYSDTLNFYLTAEQTGNAAVQAEIAAFNAAGAANNNDWTFAAMDFSIVSVETVVFHDYVSVA